MSKVMMAICENGHPIQQLKAPIEKDSSIANFCPECGSKVINRCSECQNPLIVSTRDERSPRIPDYCYGCGEAYPWLDPVENKKQREEDFLTINDSELNGHFYPSLIYEINLCYQVQADQAALILTRKLIENLIVDSLRKAFSMDEIELFYDPENNRTLPLSDLVDNMKQRSNDLSSYSSAVDEDLFRKIDELKYRGDASAHSIEENASNIDMEEKSDIATEVAKVLFRLRQEAATAHRNR